MIKYHPSTDLLDAFAAGELPTSMAIALSAHVELCQECQVYVAVAEDKLAANAFNDDAVPSEWNEDAEHEMLAAIFADTAANDNKVMTQSEPRSSQITVGDKTYALPRALQRFGTSTWASFGKVQRARLNLDEGATRASFLHIDEGGSVPAHTHKGYELTLLLDGTFEDESGRYVPGDFILLDNRHHHTPQTKEGCLCYTVANAPLYFTKGMSKLLNTVGHAIY
ncbi:ChrR family anti-sigma-E factor [Salinivibrio sp. ES.052]|uniref:ChrR family anti-sigma-E factor n=1 Tax=Salinivibrio sp. ES.052 TaxID=1882823 RepID=UPI0009283D3A|nr:ChrR family anti-sigma-E factor [Salinivibrio sp. ES.052]SIN82411.1 anti-ECFsigma factor, ChrR [Salinivibrio sp. ES.052]